MKDKKKVLVTGATSFIGQALVRNLLSNDYDVTAMIRPNSSRKSLLLFDKRIKIIEVDLTNILSINCRKLDGVEMLFHVGWISDFANPRYNIEGQLINVKVFAKIVELARSIGCKKIISVGSQAECGRTLRMISERTPDNPETAYAIAKCKTFDFGVAQCQKYGINLYWPRLLSSYGPYDKERTMIMSCIKAAIYKEEIAFTGCEQIWDYVYVDDVAVALMRIAEKGTPEVKYSIASGKGRKLSDYIKEIAHVTGNEEILKGIGKKEYVENQVMYLVGDISKLQEDTGFAPTVSFKEGIQKIIRINYENR